MPIIIDPSSYAIIPDYIAALNRETIGRPEEYEVFVVDRSLGAVLTALPWSGFTWGRRLSDFSEANITVPAADGGLGCCDEIGGLKPWRYGLRFERDGKTVFTGPVMSIARAEGSDDVDVRARDVMAWTTKRVQRFDRLDEDRMATDRYARNILAQVILDAFVVDDIPLSNITQVLAGLGPELVRDYLSDRLQRSYEIIQELSRSGIDYTVVGTDLLFGDFADIGTLGLFTEEAFLGVPAAAIDGGPQTNTVYVTTGTGVGEPGFGYGFYSSVDPLDGVLEEVFVEPENEAGATVEVNAAARTWWNDRHAAIPTLSNAKLSSLAPVPIEALIPGMLITVEALESCLWPLITMRLTGVDVSVSAGDGAVTEDVGVTLQMNLSEE